MRPLTTLLLLALPLLGSPPSQAQPPPLHGGPDALSAPAVFRTGAITGDQQIGLFGLPLAEAERNDLQALFPFGNLGREWFAAARWTLGEADATLVTLPPRGLLGEVTLTGKREVRGGRTELHLGFWSPRGATLTLDGELIPERKGFRIDAVFVALARGARHLERLTARLEVAPDTPVGPGDRDLLERAAQAEEAATTPPLTTEPSTVSRGVPVPTIYDLTIVGRTEAGAFGPLPGVLLLMSAAQGDVQPLTVTLATSGKIVNGWSVWNSHRDAGHQAKAPPPGPPGANTTTPGDRPAESGVQVELPGQGQVVLRIAPTGTMRSMTWFLGNPDDRDGARSVLVETATLSVRVTGDAVSGRIEATGTVVGGEPRRTAIEAEVTGTRQGAAQLDTVMRSLGGPQPFAGGWSDERLGRLEIRQTARVLSGMLDPPRLAAYRGGGGRHRPH
jgi:hypothetical protein